MLKALPSFSFQEMSRPLATSMEAWSSGHSTVMEGISSSSRLSSREERPLTTASSCWGTIQAPSA